MNKDELINKASEFIGEATEKTKQISSEVIEASKNFAESACHKKYKKRRS